jgi:hypothetical protein
MGISLGDMLITLADWISQIARLLINITVGAVVIFLALRWLNDVLGANPFGRLSYYLRKPTNDLVYYVRSSQFYFPFKQALRFDPTYLLVLIAVAIVWYVALSVIGYLNTVLGRLGMSLPRRIHIDRHVAARGDLLSDDVDDHSFHQLDFGQVQPRGLLVNASNQPVA